MPGYMHPCRYCNQLIEADSNACPLCGKINPLGPLRCQKCRSPIRKGESHCNHCGLSLTIPCPQCTQMTFFGDYCEYCQTELHKICPKCKTKQSLSNEVCEKCKKPI